MTGRLSNWNKYYPPIMNFFSQTRVPLIVHRRTPLITDEKNPEGMAPICPVAQPPSCITLNPVPCTFHFSFYILHSQLPSHWSLYHMSSLSRTSPRFQRLWEMFSYIVKTFSYWMGTFFHIYWEKRFPFNPPRFSRQNGFKAFIQIFQTFMIYLFWSTAKSDDTPILWHSFCFVACVV